MKLTNRICVIFLFSFFMHSSYAETKLVQVIIDNSGILHDEKDPQNKSTFDAFVSNFLSKLASKYRRDRKDTTIKIISASTPPRTVWSGSASDFSRKGVKSNEIKLLLGNNKRGCNDLPVAFEDATISKSIEKKDKNFLYIITSGVHSGADCDSLTHEKYEKLVITLDSKVTKKLIDISKEFDFVSIQFLTSEQRRLFFNALNNSKLAQQLVTQGQPPSINGE